MSKKFPLKQQKEVIRCLMLKTVGSLFIKIFYANTKFVPHSLINYSSEKLLEKSFYGHERLSIDLNCENSYRNARIHQSLVVFLHDKY